MSYYKTEFVAQAVMNGWVLRDPMIYYSDQLNREVVVPRSFFTDLASVPRIFRWLVPVANAKNRRAAVVHDLLCHEKYQKHYGISQAIADKVFKEAMRVEGIAGWKASIVYNSVRAFQMVTKGSKYWKVPQ